MSKQAANGATEAEKLVEVRLLRNYVPVNAEFDTTPDEDHLPEEKKTKLYRKRLAGDVVSLPRSEARKVIDAGIAVITADLV